MSFYSQSTPFTMFRENENQPFLKYSDDPSSNESDCKCAATRSRSRATVRFLPHAVVFLVTSLLWLLVLLLVIPAPSSHHSAANDDQRHNITSHARLISCGNSTEEARAQGCKYDILMNNWIPAPCFDQEWLDEYLEDNSWGAYADKGMTRRLTVDEMSETDSYYTSVRDHVNHCSTMWKKQFWTLYEERSAIDEVIASPGHTEHCAQYLMDVMDSDWDEPTRVHMGFAGCWVRE